VSSAIKLHTSDVIPREGFVHGFPERSGGVSTGLRASLNLGSRWGDDKALVDENRRLLAAHVGYAPDELQVTKHVHGTSVWRVGEPQPDPPEFDGLVTDRVGPVLGAFAADCIPMVFADPVARVIGAAHAGWRGTVNGVGANVVARMAELGARPENIRAGLGPSMGRGGSEAGPGVVEGFRPKLAHVPGMVAQGPRKDHVDLRVAMRTQLERAGLRPEHIDSAPPCTRCEPERFFSYRRDGKDGGVHMGFIALR